MPALLHYRGELIVSMGFYQEISAYVGGLWGHNTEHNIEKPEAQQCLYWSRYVTEWGGGG